MSWYRPLAILACAGVLLAAGACGYRPLYGERGATASVRASLGSVRVLPIPDRRGQLMYNALLDRLTPNGVPANPRYVLRVKVKESKAELGIRKDETATRANLIMGAEYELVELSTGAVIETGKLSSITSYNIVTSEYTAIRAEVDARRRAIALLADEVQLLLALYFNRAKSRPSKPAPAGPKKTQ